MEREVFAIEKELEIKSVKTVFEGFEIRSPEIEALVNGKTTRSEASTPTIDTTKNQFLDKFQKVEDHKNTEILPASNNKLDIPKPNSNIIETSKAFPNLRNKPNQVSDFSHDIDLLGASTKEIGPGITNEKVIESDWTEVEMKGTSFGGNNLSEIKSQEFKVPKSKVLNLKTKNEKNNNEENVKKTSYFGGKMGTNKNPYEDSFI